MQEESRLTEIVFLIIFVALIAFTGIRLMDNYRENVLETNSSSSILMSLEDNGTSTTLSSNQIISNLVTTSNDTWLNFDGVDDSIFITDNSYETISYWVNDTTNDWIHVVNTSGRLYENGNEVSSLTLNSYKQNATGWYIGINSSGNFKGNIDEIRFYNDTINETIVDEVYSNGR